MNQNPEFRNLNETSQIAKTAKARLANLGLTLKELEKFGLVLDIGAKDCYIQRAINEQWVNNVVSVDKTFPESIRKSSLNVLVNDAKRLEIATETVDLALVGASAYYYTKTEEETLAILQEINRTLKSSGQQRVYPARFGHIIKKLLTPESDFAAAKSLAPERRSKKDIEVIMFNDHIANLKSLEFLTDRGIFAKMREGYEPNAPDNFKHYLTIPKF